MTFDAFVTELVEHPGDDGLRAMFADWLLEHGDARGEAMVLEGKDKRRLEALRKKHALTWLGPFAQVADVDACRFRGGFPTALVLKTGAPPPDERATVAFVEELSLHAPSTQLLQALRGLKRLTADIDTLVALGKAKVPFRLERCEVSIERGYATFRELSAELDRVAEVTALERCPVYVSIPAYMQPVHADFIAEAVLRSALAERDLLGLNVRQGAFDAVSHWLSWAPSWGGGTQWAARCDGLAFCAHRAEDDRFRVLQIDLEQATPKSVAVAASILSQLQSLSLSRVDVAVPEGVRPRKQMLDTLQAARRLLPSVEKLRVTQKKR